MSTSKEVRIKVEALRSTLEQIELHTLDVLKDVRTEEAADVDDREWGPEDYKFVVDALDEALGHAHAAEDSVRDAAGKEGADEGGDDDASG